MFQLQRLQALQGSLPLVYRLLGCGMLLCCLPLAPAHLIAAPAWRQELDLNPPGHSSGLPSVAPEQVGLDKQRLQQIQVIAEQAIAERLMPGCVIVCGRHGKIAYLQAFGDKQVLPKRVAMTTDTVFDIASLTKPVATATAVMGLIETGKLRLADRVSDFFPEFAIHEKAEITVFDLLTHQSGLIPDNAMSDYAEGPAIAWQRICELRLFNPVGETFKYSDVNFIVLAKLVEKISGQNLNQFTQEKIFQPLGMRETMFLPTAELRLRAAPTQQRDGRWLQGEVHDPRAAALEGVAGHAGLFSTAEDLARFAQMILDHGCIRNSEGALARRQDRSIPETHTQPTPEGSIHHSVLSPRSIATMIRPYPVSSGTRGLGWDHLTGFSSNRGDLFSPAAIGHGGFTGTVLWIDPQLDLFYIFLSNRVHPDGEGSINPVAGRIANVIAGSVIDSGVIDGSVIDGSVIDGSVIEDRVIEDRVMQDTETSSEAQSRPPRIEAADSVPQGPHPFPLPIDLGIDVLQRENFRRLRGQRIGLISNQTGQNQNGIPTVDLFAESSAVNLTALFSPEHGWDGDLDQAKIDNGQEAKSRLPIFSLYGDTRQPSAEMLESVDTLVFDIQDVGTRFYTYASTLRLAMEAAATHGKKFIVLDRPNPMGGWVVSGPMLDPEQRSFVGFHELPVRHGMTIGELALMFQSERQLDLDLSVVPCHGYRRSQMWQDTYLTWIQPSPNLKNFEQAFLYPGVGLWEMTNLSVGRGTEHAFEIFGAPWMEGPKMASALTKLRLPGVSFQPFDFTPNSSKFAMQHCGGVKILVTDHQAASPADLGWAIASQLRALYPAEWEVQQANRLLGNNVVYQALLENESWLTLREKAAEQLRTFVRRRGPYLLYEE